MEDLIFVHTSFEKIFCQNKIKKNCKLVTRVPINHDWLSGLGRYFLLYIELIFFGFLSDIAAMSRQGGQKDADRKQRDGRKHDAQDR